MIGLHRLGFVAVILATLPALAEEAGPPQGKSELLQRFQIKEARQGVGVDADVFYAVDNSAIAKYDKKTGALVSKWGKALQSISTAPRWSTARSTPRTPTIRPGR